jgi:glycine/D-amino acid oxidase-like deaminating enzyme
MKEATISASGAAISTDVAINIAGPWAAGLAAMAGLEIPIGPLGHFSG